MFSCTPVCVVSILGNLTQVLLIQKALYIFPLLQWLFLTIFFTIAHCSVCRRRAEIFKVITIVDSTLLVQAMAYLKGAPMSLLLSVGVYQLLFHFCDKTSYKMKHSVRLGV